VTLAEVLVEKPGQHARDIAQVSGADGDVSKSPDGTETTG